MLRAQHCHVQVDDSGAIELPEFLRVTKGLRQRMAGLGHLSPVARAGSQFSAGKECAPCCRACC